MRKISLIASLIIFASCTKHYKGSVEVTFYNGDKDTLHIEWDRGLELTKGDLKEPYWDVASFASSVRTYKILNK